MIINTGLPLAGGVRFSSGSYQGTGTYGAANPNSLTFDFVPKLVIITPYATEYNDKGHNVLGIFIPASGAYVPMIANSGSSGRQDVHSEGVMATPVTLDGTTLSWYYSGTAAGDKSACPDYQFNSQKTTYHWVAFG